MKITWDAACEVRLREAQGRSRKEIAYEFQLTLNYVGQILRYEVWKKPTAEKKIRLPRPCRKCKTEVAGPIGLCGVCRVLSAEKQASRKRLQSQKHCDVCGTSYLPFGRLTLCADHNHKTGEFRGTLCGNCNNALGMLGENPRILKSMLAYIEKHGACISKTLLR